MTVLPGEIFELAHRLRSMLLGFLAPYLQVTGPGVGQLIF
jgi:hypothetical protein